MLASIRNTVGGNELTLVVGGVKAFNLDNFCNRKGAAEHFKLFVGFQNLVCTNLCVRTDGYLGDLRVGSLDQLRAAVCRDYYRGESFCRDEAGNINLRRLYNLFTGANKSTYIDQFLDRSVNPLDLALQVQNALEGRSTSWYLS
ncbi:DUF3871 family protein [Hymenobacter sp. B81]|uniref:DUF3871 family protein n=1 Tax=Hymenobacter sp. B81 TaxID=3344878 RepID=UPI0037DC3F50